MNNPRALHSLTYQDPTCFCQVCGFQLSEQPVALAQWEYIMICPSCGMHYGNDDYTEMMQEAKERYGHSVPSLLPEIMYRELRALAWANWRLEWFNNGPMFWHEYRQSERWNPQQQLMNLGIDV